MKPTCPIEPDGAAVGGADRQVCAARTHVLNRPGVHIRSPLDQPPVVKKPSSDLC